MLSSSSTTLLIRFSKILIVLLLLQEENLQFSYASSSTMSARSLDELLQNYAYQSLNTSQTVTGKIYSTELPGNLSGISVSVVRLRGGSLRSRGFKIFNVIYVPVGIKETPFVKRLALVYHNLGNNWSSVYHQILPGYKFLTPVVGLLVYDASDLSRSTTNLPELKIVLQKSPISINFISFLDQGSLLTGEKTRCVSFHLNGTYAVEDLRVDSTCLVHDQGHFAVVKNWSSSPSPPPPPKSEIKGWKIIAFVTGGFLGLVFLVVLMIWVTKHGVRRKKKSEMESDSEVYEDLGTRKIGDTRLPVASTTRTRPVLEKDDVP